MTEVWKDVVGYNGDYLVSNLGRVKLVNPTLAHKRGRYKVRIGILKPHVADGAGHLAVTLRNLEGGSKRHYVHHLVLEAFTGPRPKGQEARHFPDRDPTNNRVTNLVWGSRKENMNDKRVQGTYNPPPVLSGSLNGMFGRKHTVEAKDKMRGRTFSEEHKAKLREAWKRRKAES